VTVPVSEENPGATDLRGEAGNTVVVVVVIAQQLFSYCQL